jgi:hypothetical protein
MPVNISDRCSHNRMEAALALTEDWLTGWAAQLRAATVAGTDLADFLARLLAAVDTFAADGTVADL